MDRVTAGLLVACALAASCSGERVANTPVPSSSETAGATSPEAESSESPKSTADHSLFYLKGRVLRRLDPRTGRDEKLRAFPTADVALSPDGGTAAYVAPTAPGGDEDFVEAPAITLIDVSTGETTDLGPGVTPSFSPGGELLAWLRPTGDRACEGEACTGRSSVVVSDASGDGATEALPPASWTILGWAGDLVVAADQSDPGAVTAAGLDRPAEQLPVSAEAFWGAAPNGTTLLRVAGNKARVVSFPEGDVVGDVEVKGTLGEGAWSPDSTTIAAVRLGDVLGGVPESELVLLRLKGGSVQALPDSAGAVGQVSWTPDSFALVYVRSAPPKGLNLEAVYCLDPPRGRCRSLFTWVRGVQVLRLT